MRKPESPRLFPLWLLLLALIGACRAPAAPSLHTPQPYATRTPTLIHWQPSATLAPPSAPIPSATPFPYTIRSGDTLEGLARRFNLSVDQLLRANPGLTSLLQPGQVIQVPAPAAETAPATPTPAALLILPPDCYPLPISGQTCFFPITNPSADWIENISLQVELTDAQGNRTTQVLFPLLNVIPPQSTLPIAATFPTPPEQTAHLAARLVSAVRLLPGDKRYRPATLHRLQVLIAPSGYQAELRGEIHLPPEAQPANLVWVLAVAYDAQGNVVGLRRWEGNGLPAGSILPFQLSLSAFAPIQNVEFLVEAR